MVKLWFTNMGYLIDIVKTVLSWLRKEKPVLPADGKTKAMEMTLKRILFTDDGVIGVLTCGNRPVCLTLEEEWKNNEKGISCIPEGSYLCKRVLTPKHGDTFEVMEVPGRNAILFHSGNTEADTEGCILTGKEFGEIESKDDDTGVVEKQLAVLRSKEAFKNFMDTVGIASTFALHIKNC